MEAVFLVVRMRTSGHFKMLLSGAYLCWVISKHLQKLVENVEWDVFLVWIILFVIAASSDINWLTIFARTLARQECLKAT